MVEFEKGNVNVLHLKYAHTPSEIIFEGDTLELREYRGCVLKIKEQIAIIWWEAPGVSAGCDLNLKHLEILASCSFCVIK